MHHLHILCEGQTEEILASDVLALAKVIEDERFVPHLVLHETETWVLADCRQLGEVMGDLGPAMPSGAPVRTPTTGSANLRRECHARLRGDQGNTAPSNKCTAPVFRVALLQVLPAREGCGQMAAPLLSVGRTSLVASVATTAACPLVNRRNAQQ